MSPNRKPVFNELHRLVSEYDDCIGANERWNVDDALSDLIIRLNGETRRARKLHQATDTEVICNV